MNEPFPKKLNKEPLIDAVFEVRFQSVAPASNILPGLLFGKLDGEKLIEKLAISQLPEQVRMADPNLKYAPVLRILWGKFSLLISDNGIAVSCGIPYPGWTTFKNTILEIFCLLAESQMIKSVERYSLKYVDILPLGSLEEQVDAIDMDLTLGGRKLEKNFFQVRVDMPVDGFANIVAVTSSANTVLPSGETRHGVAVDIDTILDNAGMDIMQIRDSLSENLHRMHNVNSHLFFSCLKREAVDSLEPIYE